MEPGCLANDPEKGATPGWYFRIPESSATVWLVEGSDADGRTVSRQGLDEDQPDFVVDGHVVAAVARQVVVDGEPCGNPANRDHYIDGLRKAGLEE